MPLYKVPVKCGACGAVALVINPGDKVYCLACDYSTRLPTILDSLWPTPSDHSNSNFLNYYIRQLETLVLESRGIDPQQFRLGNVDGRPVP